MPDSMPTHIVAGKMAELVRAWNEAKNAEKAATEKREAIEQRLRSKTRSSTLNDAGETAKSTGVSGLMRAKEAPWI